MSAEIEVKHEDQREEDRPTPSRWVRRRVRRLVIGVVVGGAVLTGIARLMWRGRKGSG